MLHLSAYLFTSRLKNILSRKKKAMEFIASRLAFTTHTPVAAGHDRFLLSDVKKVIPDNLFKLIPKKSCSSWKAMHDSALT